MENTEIYQSIQKLKREKNAVLLAHLYEPPEIQHLADFTGDSLELSRKARDTQADVIVFCGVRFMAETAKILNPGRTVLLPEPNAGCPMADMVTPGDVAKLREAHPGAAVVCYINSSAEVKAVSDICCTSSNAIKVIGALKEKEIIFVPDRNLGHYASRFLPEKRFILFDGYCPVHDKMDAAAVAEARALHPDALLLVHPECVPAVVDLADFTGSTTQIINYAVESDRKEFIIGTENGVLSRLKELCPEKQFYSLHAGMVCPDMKKTSLESVRSALEKLQYRIELDEQLIRKASVCIDRMLSL